MKKGLRRRSLEDFEARLEDEGIDDVEVPGNFVLQNEIDDVSSGATSIYKAMKRIRSHVQESGLSTDPLTYRLGKLKAGNENRDFWSATEIPVDLEFVSVPVLDEKSPAGYQVVRQPVLLPHRIMAYLCNHCELDIPESAIHQYWDNAIASKETYASLDSRHRVPLGFYGDAAQLVTKCRIEKMLCFFANIVIFRPRSIRYSRFLLWSCDVSLLYKNRTVNSILRWVVWSFNILYEGIYPSARPGGLPLASKAERDLAGTWLTRQKYQFQVVEVRGDWEFHKMLWQFKSSWKGGVNVGICFRCPAMTRSPDVGLQYWNMDDEDSTWAREEFNTHEFISKMVPGVNICPLLNLKKFDLSCIKWCMMHVINLGILMSLNGGALTMLTEQMEYWGPGTFQQQLDSAYADFISFCRARKLHHSQPPFKENKVKPTWTGTPEISLNAKAWNGRIMCSWLAETMNHAAHGYDVGYDDGRLTLVCYALKCMARFFWLCEANPRELSVQAATSIYAEGRGFLRAYRSLAALSIRKGMHTFLLKPKFHAMLHILRDVRRLRKNPRYYHTYADEDSMKWAKGVAKWSTNRNKRASWILKCQRLRLLSMKYKMAQLKSRQFR